MTDPLHGWRNQLHQGDALAILSQLPSASIGLIVTSPPYNVRNSTGHGINSASSAWPTNKLTNGYPDHADDMPRADYLAWQRACISEMLRVLTDDGALFYNHRPRVQAGLQESPRDIIAGFHLRDEIIWHKGGGINHTPGAFTPAYEVIYHIVKNPHQFRRSAGSVDYSNVWHIPRERDNDHPAPFPVEIPRRCIQASDSPIVLDPFMGSGTTGVAAVIEGRQYVGIELNAQYCQSARLRIRRASPTVHHPPPAPPPIPIATPPTETRPALPPSELKPRERLLFDHISTLIAANHHQPITTTAKHLAAHLATNPRRIERAVQTLKANGHLSVKSLGPAGLYSIPQPANTSPLQSVDTARPTASSPAGVGTPPKSVGTARPTAPSPIGTQAKSVGTARPTASSPVGTQAKSVGTLLVSVGTVTPRPAGLIINNIKPRPAGAKEPTPVPTTQPVGSPPAGVGTHAKSVGTPAKSVGTARPTASSPVGTPAKSVGTLLVSVGTVTPRPAGLIINNIKPRPAGAKEPTPVPTTQPVGSPPAGVGTHAKSVGTPAKSVGTARPTASSPAGVATPPKSVGTPAKSVGSPPVSSPTVATPPPVGTNAPPCTILQCSCPTDFCQNPPTVSGRISRRICPKHGAPLLPTKRQGALPLPGEFTFCPSRRDGSSCTFLAHSEKGILIHCDDPRGQVGHYEFHALYHAGGRSYD